jgi:hypothetical protein
MATFQVRIFIGYATKQATIVSERKFRDAGSGETHDRFFDMTPQKPTLEAERRSIPAASGTRRSDRIDLSLPIEAIGTDLNRGRPFCEKGKTTLISRYGAAIALQYALATDQELTIRCLGSKREAEVRVVGLIAGEGQGNQLIYGVAFLDPALNPWNVEFPSLTDADEILARALLQCHLCQVREVVHLNEIEIQVFEANRRIHRFCKACSATTAWKATAGEAPNNQVSSQDKPAPEPRIQPAKKEKRKHHRVKTNVSACIRRSGLPDDIVACENVSRGGLRFRSSRHYSRGSQIQVAVPYSPGSGNIFVPSHIVHVQECEGFFRIGASYSGASSREKRPTYSGSITVADGGERFD